MTRYLMNAAVIPHGCTGTFTYRLASLEELIAFVTAGEVINTIVYPDTLAWVREVTGQRVKRPPDDATRSTLQPGDEALVIRRVTRRAQDWKLPFDPAVMELGDLALRGASTDTTTGDEAGDACPEAGLSGRSGSHQRSDTNLAVPSVREEGLMSMRRILVLLLLTSTGAQGLGLDTENTRATLRGLNGVGVVVEDLNPDVERDGLTTQQIRTDVELRLRKAGILVLTEQEWFNAPGRPRLYVQVSRYQHNGLNAYSIGVELYQDSYLARNFDFTGSAVTWSTGSLGIVGTARVRQLRETVADRVDEFINAYLAVNPEQAGRAPPPTAPPSRTSPPTKRR